MSYQLADFTAQVTLNAMIHHSYPNVASELTAIAAALATDPTAHDTTIETAPAGLMPGAATNSRFTNDVLLVVNAGKGGNLTPAAMSGAINSALGQVIPPVNTAAPVASGTGTVGQTLSVTTGTWQYSPTFTYQWQRGGAAIGGAIAATYVLVAADSGASVSCQVTATNAAGSASASSNAIPVA